MPEDTSPKQNAPKKERPHLMSYLVILFSAAFLLLLISYINGQRRSDQQISDGLQQSASAMQTAQNLIERNKLLTDENKTLREQNDALTEQAEQLEAQSAQQEKTILALDWLWRIEREYLQGRRSAARTMIQEMEQADLDSFLPDTALSDPEYRSPAEQYKSIYNSLF